MNAKHVINRSTNAFFSLSTRASQPQPLSATKRSSTDAATEVAATRIEALSAVDTNTANDENYQPSSLLSPPFFGLNSSLLSPAWDNNNDKYNRRSDSGDDGKAEDKQQYYHHQRWWILTIIMVVIFYQLHYHQSQRGCYRIIRVVDGIVLSD